MKSEDELYDFINEHSDTALEQPSPVVYLSHRMEELFAGKKLVDAGAVVLPKAEADWMMKSLQEGFTSYAREHLGYAIEQARGKNGN